MYMQSSHSHIFLYAILLLWHTVTESKYPSTGGYATNENLALASITWNTMRHSDKIGELILILLVLITFWRKEGRKERKKGEKEKKWRRLITCPCRMTSVWTSEPADQFSQQVVGVLCHDRPLQSYIFQCPTMSKNMTQHEAVRVEHRWSQFRIWKDAWWQLFQKPFTLILACFLVSLE